MLPINRWRWLEERGQGLSNIDRTHLVQASYLNKIRKGYIRWRQSYPFLGILTINLGPGGRAVRHLLSLSGQYFFDIITSIGHQNKFPESLVAKPLEGES